MTDLQVLATTAVILLALIGYLTWLLTAPPGSDPGPSDEEPKSAPPERGH